MNETPAAPAVPTQTQHPWRATVRTVVATIIGWAPFVPAIVAAVEGDNRGALGPVGVAAITAAGVVTRVMAVPAVNRALTKIGLGSTPASELDPPR